MKFGIIALVMVFTMALSLVWIQPISSQSNIDGSSELIQEIVEENPDIVLNDAGIPVQKGGYFVLLNNQTFASVDNDPKFADKDQIKASNNPEKNAKIVPALKHEYEMKIAAIIYEKVRQYNGTYGNSLSPLRMQDASVDDVWSHAVRGFEVQDIKDISIFARDPDIELVEKKPIAIPTTQYSSFNSLRAGINQGPNAANNVEAPLPDVDIAIIDQAILRTHPDLNVAGTATFCFVPAGTTCYPPNGSHGTKSAGTAAARDNLAGVVGSAPGARVWSFAICPGGTGCNDIVSALDYITANAAIFEVASSSTGISSGIKQTAPTSCAVCNTAIANAVAADVTVVVSAGNDGVNADNKGYCSAPAVICVSAMADSDGKCGGNGPSVGPFNDGAFGNGITQKDDQRAYFSNFGSAVDLMAPGDNNLLTAQSLSTGRAVDTVPTLPFIGTSSFGGYGFFGGTSEAAPWVAGAAAMLKALHPTWTPAQIKTDLQTNGFAQDAPCNTSTGLGGLRNNPNSGGSEKILNLAAID